MIPNGVDTRRFAPFQMSPAIRRELGIGADRSGRRHRRGAAAGKESRAVSRNGASRVAATAGRAISRSSATARAAKRSNSGPENWALRPNVLFLGSRDDVPRLLAAMDVFALTSHIEANPVSILEAMSVGRPVVATNVGSIHEAVVDGETGFLVPPGDADQFADRVLRLLNDPLAQPCDGRGGRETVVERWSIEVDGPRLRATDRVDLCDERCPLSVVFVVRCECADICSLTIPSSELRNGSQSIINYDD